MIDKFKPKKVAQATEEELTEIAIIRAKDWQASIRTADPDIQRYLRAEIDNGSINSR